MSTPQATAQPPGAPADSGAARARITAALNSIDALLERSDRPDLDIRAAAIRNRLGLNTCNVLIAGEFKKGKSSLVNALVNAPVCPVDDDVATAKPMEIHHAPEPVASIALKPLDPSLPGQREIRPITLEQIPSYVAEPLSGPDADLVASVRVGIPRQLLASGLALVDTPGVGGLGSSHSAITIGALPQADAVLFVTDASQELTASELEFLRTIRSICPTVTCVMTKIDFYPSWRKILEINQNHLRQRNLDIRIIPTSSVLRNMAIERNDRELNVESGFNELVTYLRDEVASETDAALIKRAAAELTELLDHLESQLRAELSVLDDPEESARMMRQLETAKERAANLKSQAARWQQTLNDGITDLRGDVEHDLRGRFRLVVKEAEEAIDSFDPARTWDEFQPWLSRRATAEIVANYTLLHQRSVQLAAHVATHFDADHNEIAQRLQITDPNALAVNLGFEGQLGQDAQSAFGMAISAMRGTSGGMIMLSAFAGLAGVTLVPVAVVAVGALLGRKALKDDKARQLAQRRLQAKNNVRKYADDIMFTAGKDSRDTLSRISRQLREHFALRAEELSTSTSESLAAAQQAIRSSQEGREKRKKEVAGLLEALRQARQLVSAAGVR